MLATVGPVGDSAMVQALRSNPSALNRALFLGSESASGPSGAGRALRILAAVSGRENPVIASSVRCQMGWSEYSTLWVMALFAYSESGRSMAVLSRKPQPLSK